MGAWIETTVAPDIAGKGLVAPCMGAWIETGRVIVLFSSGMSHPVWVRGLKL